MWKYVSRRIRDTFERSANQFEKRGSAGVVNAPGSPDEKHKRSSPQCRWIPPQTCWQTCRHNKDTNSNKWNFEYLNRSWIGAITWSSALVLGWYTSQLLHLKCKYHAKGHDKCSSINNILKSLRPYVACVNKDVICINSAPRIDKIINDFTPSVHLVSNDHHGTRNVDDTVSSSKTSSDTSSSDLGEVLNSIENKLGLAAIENGKHEDGLKLLRSAARRQYAPALYNLGLCYETGVGVSVDEKMAMELYKSAAALEHPVALYNLGIYYGQGRGGLTRDSETGIRLLRLAAIKGQEDAIKALKELNVDIGESSPKINMEETWTYTDSFPQNKNIVPMQTTLFVENASFLQTPNCLAPVC
ncbi:uncharacterized protein LOC115447289 [Manduca sexta]|uniref:uncharacterized protein LOC115447289 n=1 Tax=Manduca sexta TaxID=7130 RepID=UPI00188E6B3F|nr:uncharacterized protein LOC115447289 [Manduca sexta]